MWKQNGKVPITANKKAPAPSIDSGKNKENHKIKNKIENKK